MQIFTIQAHGQLALLPEDFTQPTDSQMKQQGLESAFQIKFPLESFSEDFNQPEPIIFSQAQVRNLAQALDQQFQHSQRILDGPRPLCQSSEITSYLLALQIKGDLESCHDLARQCEQSAITPYVSLMGALCNSTRYNYTASEQFFEKATDRNRWQNHPDFSEAVIQRAAYSLYGHAEDQVDSILSLLPQTSERDQRLWKGVLQRAGEMDLVFLSKAEVDAFLDQQIQRSQTSLRGLLLSLRIRILQRSGQHQKALDTLYSRNSEIKNPLFWYFIAYNTVYYGLDRNFAWSREIYDVYRKYSHIWMSFPIENNTYNYTQIYSQVCVKNLVPLQYDEQEQRQGSSVFRETQKKLRKGEISAQEALQLWSELKPRLEDKADFLTAYGGLLSLLGRHEEAFDFFFKAHKLCPYYNRAHWGLAVEKRFFQHRGRPDFEKLNAQLDQELQNRPVPTEIASYITNWNSLSPEAQKRVAYGARIFLPYIQTLESQNFYTYLKFGFDLLSDSPDFESLRDRRIGGSGYPHDNRLWDDVRGAGGRRVVADISEVFNGVQGDYNLLGHEMAHQFQDLLEKLNHPGFDCIARQYQEALEKKNFPDAYSSQNKEEHFAQGVTYYLVPSDSPSRFGLNRSWLIRNNPDQLRFVQSIDQARGRLDLIKCQDSAVQDRSVP